MELRYKSKWSRNILADYCWTVNRKLQYAQYVRKSSTGNYKVTESIFTMRENTDCFSMLTMCRKKRGREKSRAYLKSAHKKTFRFTYFTFEAKIVFLFLTSATGVI